MQRKITFDIEANFFLRATPVCVILPTNTNPLIPPRNKALPVRTHGALVPSNWSGYHKG